MENKLSLWEGEEGLNRGNSFVMAGNGILPSETICKLSPPFSPSLLTVPFCYLHLEKTFTS